MRIENGKEQMEKIALNTKEAIAYTGLNRSLLESYRKAGLIRTVKAGRLYLYPVNELKKFMDRMTGKEISKDGVIY